MNAYTIVCEMLAWRNSTTLLKWHSRETHNLIVNELWILTKQPVQYDNTAQGMLTVLI